MIRIVKAQQRNTSTVTTVLCQNRTKSEETSNKAILV